MNLKTLTARSAAKFAGAALGLAAVGAALVIGIIALLPEDTATAKKHFCTSLSNLSSTVMSYQGLDPGTATTSQRDDAAAAIGDAWNDVVDDANDWANAYDNPLRLAYDDLYWAIQDQPSDNTVAEDIAAVEPELAAFPQAYRDTFDGSGCTTA